jgi:hypothetical protein
MLPPLLIALFTTVSLAARSHADLETLRAFSPRQCVARPGVSSTAIQTIYPLGFSRSGLFAYLTENSVDEGNAAKLIVVDLDTQRVVEIFGRGEVGRVSELLRLERGAVSKILEEQGIEPLDDPSPSQFPLRIDGRTVDATVRRTRNGENETVRVILRSGSREREIARLERYLSVNRNVDAVEGYLRSPFDGRIAVIASGTSYVLDDQWECRVYVFGAEIAQSGAF